MLKLKEEFKKMELDEIQDELFWNDQYIHVGGDGLIYIVDTNKSIVYSTYCHMIESVFTGDLIFYSVDDEMKNEILNEFYGE